MDVRGRNEQLSQGYIMINASYRTHAFMTNKIYHNSQNPKFDSSFDNRNHHKLRTTHHETTIAVP